MSHAFLDERAAKYKSEPCDLGYNIMGVIMVPAVQLVQRTSAHCTGYLSWVAQSITTQVCKDAQFLTYNTQIKIWQSLRIYSAGFLVHTSMYTIQ